MLHHTDDIIKIHVIMKRLFTARNALIRPSSQSDSVTTFGICAEGSPDIGHVHLANYHDPLLVVREVAERKTNEITTI